MSNQKTRLNFNLISILLYILLINLPIIISVQSDSKDDEDEPIGIYGTLRGFVGDLGKIVNDVTTGIHKLRQGIRNVEEFLDATIDEDCVFECPNGETYEPNLLHFPTSNGCGSLGLEEYLSSDMLPTAQFISCCDTHDFCYGVCGNDKDECDLKFKKCLYKKCSEQKEKVSKLKHKSCQAGAKLLYTGTTALGCKPFINAQREACSCPNSKMPRDEF